MPSHVGTTTGKLGHRLASRVISLSLCCIVIRNFNNDLGNNYTLSIEAGWPSFKCLSKCSIMYLLLFTCLKSCGTVHVFPTSCQQSILLLSVGIPSLGKFPLLGKSHYSKTCPDPESRSLSFYCGLMQMCFPLCTSPSWPEDGTRGIQFCKGPNQK